MAAYPGSALLVSTALVLGCGKHTTGDPDPGETSTIGTTDASSSEPTTAGMSAGTTTTPGEACVPDPERWQGILCIPKTTDVCGPCDTACQESPEAGALAEDVANAFGCCDFWEITPLCGPVEHKGQCCHTIEVKSCACVDAVPNQS